MAYFYETGIVCVSNIKNQKKFEKLLKIETQKEIIEENGWFTRFFSDHYKTKTFSHQFFGDEKEEKIIVYYLKTKIRETNFQIFAPLMHIYNLSNFAFSAILLGEEWGDKSHISNVTKENQERLSRYENVADSILYPVQYVELDLEEE